MTTMQEIQELLINLLVTALAICVFGLIGALCWWAWASESLVNILTLAGLMAVGAGVLIAVLLAWLKLTEEKS